uniref:Uncharacterized protein n=1 Tax=Anguilla anguilla TaxID=7936 RepID=A0A0E9WUH3_ANGAN
MAEKGFVPVDHFHLCNVSYPDAADTCIVVAQGSRASIPPSFQFAVSAL